MTKKEMPNILKNFLKVISGLALILFLIVGCAIVLSSSDDVSEEVNETEQLEFDLNQRVEINGVLRDTYEQVSADAGFNAFKQISFRKTKYDFGVIQMIVYSDSGVLTFSELQLKEFINNVGRINDNICISNNIPDGCTTEVYSEGNLKIGEYTLSKKVELS
ncbi:MAG TPA: hypothetical protein VKE88_00995 [Candidatus Nanoarchaeia archaeon]|nr:hypothetical protein [Candidatus Nanoarchaeia archaeon]